MFLSWLWLPAHGFWQTLDNGVFFAFQKLIAQSTAFTYFVAFTNLRPFDAVAFLCMLAIYLYHFRKADARGRRWMVAMGLSMMVAVVLAKQCDMLMHFERPSPTKYFIEQGVPALKVSTLTGWPSKDASGMSFPGDHGMMLIIFAAFMLRYYGKKNSGGCGCRRCDLFVAAHDERRALDDGCRRRRRLDCLRRAELDAADAGVG